ncbi:MAG TPA: pyridoxal phosphate-dependent aminotransferase, partial [Terriglobia bacterium]|nr:pyridoxal phosphate-dependent aminotransferase [Terriglobia bacterium]
WLRKGATHYSPVPGVWDLRTAIAAHLSAAHPAKIDPRNVLVTPGAKMMIFSIIQSIVDPGDEVICPDPSYPAYEAAIRMAGATAVRVKLEESKQFRFDLKELERLITSRTKLIVVNSPQNPTGGVLTLDDLKRIADLARKHDLLILSDEIYSEIYYTDRPASILDVPDILDRVFLVNGFSKIYAMTGWRLGYGIVPADTFASIDLFINNSVSSTATFTQKAALEAFTPETDKATAKMVAEFKKRRDAFADGLNQIPGIRCLKPLGAFYLFPNISGVGLSSDEFANRLLNEAGVAALPGTAFGDYGEGYVRFSFANSLANLELALERIRSFVSSCRGGL